MKRTTICIIEDDLAVRESLVAFLGCANFHTECFEAAEDFEPTEDKNHPDCFIVDVRLPGMSGIDFVHQLIRNGTQVPIIVVSGHDESLAIDELLKLDHVWYMKKPYSPNDLLHCIQLGLDIREVEQASTSSYQNSRLDRDMPRD